MWIIGDVHGEYNKLEALLKLLPENAQICFVGDLVDRGKDSTKVLELIIEKGYHCVLGNHELMMLKSTYVQEYNSLWLPNGGQETLASYEEYDFETYKKMYVKHLRWLKELPYFLHFEVEGYKPLVVSHSYIHHEWINKDHIYCEYDGYDILWRHAYNREHFDTEREIKNNIFNIFGHTALKEPLVTDTYAIIDTGATCAEYGVLSAIHYPTLKVIKCR